jgi:2-keto-3-deoxy-L-fuconate dehydrogenase
MSDRLKGKRAFVTAAAVGIGRACALAFAREGATVFATDIDESKLAALKNEGVAEVAKLDARDSAAVAAMAKRAGKTDILLNAAGFVHHGTVLDCSDEDWDFSFDLNVKSMHRTIRSFLPGMLENGGGSIVNISSAAGVFKAAHRNAVDAAACRRRRPAGTRDVYRAAADGTARHCGRDRIACHLSRQRRKRVHDRCRPRHRWRLDALIKEENA